MENIKNEEIVFEKNWWDSMLTYSQKIDQQN